MANLTTVARGCARPAAKQQEAHCSASSSIRTCGSRRCSASRGDRGTGRDRCTITARRPALDLTDREGDVVSLVAKGLSNREIAGQLYVSVKTVEYHLGNVFAKLGISSRRELRGVLVAQ